MSPDTFVLNTSMFFELTVIAVVLYRKVWKVLPVFALYVCWALASDVFFFFLPRDPIQRFADYYLFETFADAILQFAVLVELSWSVLRPIRKSLPRYTPGVVAVLVAVAGVIIWPLAAMTVATGLNAQFRLISHVQETFAILRIVFFLVLACLSQLLAIGWRDRELQVATGLGVYSIVSLLVALLHSHQGPADWGQGDWYHRLDLAVSISYVGTLVYWVASFYAKVPERKEFSPQMQQLLVLMGGGARSSSIALTDLTSERSRKRD